MPMKEAPVPADSIARWHFLRTRVRTHPITTLPPEVLARPCHTFGGHSGSARLLGERGRRP